MSAMKTALIFFIVTYLEILSPGSCTSTHNQILSITPSTTEQVNVVKNVSTRFKTTLWQPAAAEFITEHSEVHLFVPAETLSRVMDILQRNNITNTVLLTNTDELIEMQTRNDSSDPRSSSSFYEKYHSLEDIYWWINRTSQENPDTVKVILLGSSYEKRPIYALKLSLNNRTNKKAMWIDCGIHAREWISHAFCLWFVQYSLSFYKQNPEITFLLDNLDVYVLPVLNPDGYRYTWTKDRMWRKNLSVDKRTGCVGVDLNRNFDANWCTAGASPNPCSEIYCGAFPESEPESEAVANFLRGHKDSITLYISIHAYSQLILFPYSYTFEEAAHHNEMMEMAREAAKSIRRHYKNNYKYGPGAKTIYVAPGGSDDWAYNLGINYSYTFELQDRGRYGFLLPPSRIHIACNEALLAVKKIATKVIEKTQVAGEL